MNLILLLSSTAKLTQFIFIKNNHKEGHTSVPAKIWSYTQHKLICPTKPQPQSNKRSDGLIPEIEKISYSWQLQLFAIQTGGPNYRHVNSPNMYFSEQHQVWLNFLKNSSQHAKFPKPTYKWNIKKDYRTIFTLMISVGSHGFWFVEM